MWKNRTSAHCGWHHSLDLGPDRSQSTETELSTDTSEFILSALACACPAALPRVPATLAPSPAPASDRLFPGTVSLTLSPLHCFCQDISLQQQKGNQNILVTYD